MKQKTGTNSLHVSQVADPEKMPADSSAVLEHPGQTGRPSGYALRPGQILDDRFLIGETVSRGGMANIFKATDLTTTETVAVKVPLMEYESDAGFYSRFEREERIGLGLSHPFILRFIAVGEKSRPYIVTEYLAGDTLAHLMNRVRPIPEKDALWLASRICDALAYLHGRGVVHRDLKPQNVMICHDGTIRIMDFGIAKAAEGRRVTFTGFTPTVGTPDYMAPELVKGKRGDERTDIYSLGAILYEMVTGQTPFAGDNENLFVIMNVRVAGDPVAPRKRNPQVSPEVEEIILHAMERDPDKRHSTVAALKADLDNPQGVQVSGRCDRLQAPSLWKQNRSEARSALLVVVIAVVVALVMVGLVLHRGPAPVAH